MARSAIELDFFSMEKESNGLPSAVNGPNFERRRSFRDIQGVISKMNPEVVKSVIENGSLVGNKRKSVVSSPKVCDSTLRLSFGYNGKNYENNAPMTIFYNGRVAVFDVSPDQAQEILKVADERLPESEYSEYNPYNLFDGDFPMKRRKSLQVFLKKRKESRGRDSS